MNVQAAARGRSDPRFTRTEEGSAKRLAAFLLLFGTATASRLPDPA